MSKLRPTETARTKGWNPVYGWPGDLPDQEPFEVWFVEANRKIRCRIGVPVGRRLEGGGAQAAEWTAELLHDALQPMLRRLNSDGAAWYAEILQPVVDGDGVRGTPALQEARRQILDGPDSPGKRFLQGHRKGVTMRGTIAEATKLPAEVAKPPKTVASRAEIDRLMTPRELPPAPDADLTDEEFFAKHPVESDGWEQGQ
ncbi:MAG: hypothetical protein PHO92_05110 [Candidatus Peribacteraceae bacterium]|nr:hypothetical protein [Candidatus Peribacteraceae bacterium]